MPRRKRPQASCHPDRPHSANGMCEECYQRDYRKKKQNAISNYRQSYKQRPEVKKKDRDRIKDLRRNGHFLKEKYGISLEEYDGLLYEQGGGCAICGREDSSRKDRVQTKFPLCVDHDHKTGIIRGLLCDECNRGLGAFKDNPELLTIAAHYLQEAVTRSQRQPPL